MFSFFKRASKKDAKISATPHKHHNLANDKTQDKNKPVEIQEPHQTNQSDAIADDISSEEDNIGIMSPMAAFRSKGKNKRRNYQHKNKNVTNKTSLVQENQPKSVKNNEKSDNKLSETVDCATTSKNELTKSLSLNPNEFSNIQKHDKLQKTTSLNPIHPKTKNNTFKQQNITSNVKDTCGNLNQSENCNDTIVGALKLQIDVPGVINQAKNKIKSGDEKPKGNSDHVSVFSVQNENKDTILEETPPTFIQNEDVIQLDENIIQIKNLAPENTIESTNVLLLPNDIPLNLENMGNTTSDNIEENMNISHVEVAENQTKDDHITEINCNNNFEVLNIQINNDLIQNDDILNSTNVEQNSPKHDVTNETINKDITNNETIYNEDTKMQDREAINCETVSKEGLKMDEILTDAVDSSNKLNGEMDFKDVSTEIASCEPSMMDSLTDVVDTCNKRNGDMDFKDIVSDINKIDYDSVKMVTEQINLINGDFEKCVGDLNCVDEERKTEIMVDISDKRNLVQAETRFQSQVTELTDQLHHSEDETNKLRYQMEDVQRDLYIKSSGMDRLQAELLAAHKDSESVRLKLKHLQEDIVKFKQKNSELGEELTKKAEEYDEIENKYKDKISQLEVTVQALTENMQALQTQLDDIKQEKDRIEQQKTQLESEREEEKKIVQEALDAAIAEKQNIQKRWEADFEKLRNVNTDREQQMFNDFEWKLREVEQSCKRRLEDKDKKLDEKFKEKQKEMEQKIKKAEEQISEVENLKKTEAEAIKLRTLNSDQARSISILTRHTNELEAHEATLKEETKKLQTSITKEKTQLILAQQRHEKELADRERQTMIRLEQQRNEVALQWEQKLRQECGRLKIELEQINAEEKHLAVELVKVQLEQQYLGLKQGWEKKLNDCMSEITTLKSKLEHIDEKHHTEMERQRTNSDRDNIQLRRELDKTEMSYHEKLEKMSEKHELELEKLNEEAEKRLKDMESNYQMQLSSMRATLELVKEQMEREANDRMQNLKEEHRTELEKQWEKLMKEKDHSVSLLEQEYRAKYDRLKEQFTSIQRNHSGKEKDLQRRLESLGQEVKEKEGIVGKFKREAEEKISSLQQQLSMEREESRVAREEHTEELAHLHKQHQQQIDQLMKKCTCLTKLFEEMRTKYDRRDSRKEDLNIISDLRNVLAEQERDLAILNEEKRYYQMELMRYQGLGNSNDDFLSAGGSNASLPDSTSDDRSTSKSEVMCRSKSLGYNNVANKNDHSLPSSLPG